MRRPISSINDHMESKNFSKGKEVRPFSRTSGVSSCHQNDSPANSPDRMTKAASQDFSKYIDNENESDPAVIKLEEMKPVRGLQLDSLSQDFEGSSHQTENQGEIDRADESFDEPPQMKVETIDEDILKKLPAGIKQIYNW